MLGAHKSWILGIVKHFHTQHIIGTETLQILLRSGNTIYEQAHLRPRRCLYAEIHRRDIELGDLHIEEQTWGIVCRFLHFFARDILHSIFHNTPRASLHHNLIEHNPCSVVRFSLRRQRKIRKRKQKRYYLYTFHLCEFFLRLIVVSLFLNRSLSRYHNHLES